MLRRPLTIGIVAATLVAVTVPAYAAWQANGIGAGTTAARTLAAPIDVSATASGRTVTLTWANGSNPAGTTTSVIRSGSVTPITGCSATSCTDSNVPAGSYTYTVAHKLHDWETSATSSHVTVDAATTTPTLSLVQEVNKTAGSAFGLSFNSGDPSITGLRPISVTGLGATGSHQPTVPTTASFSSGVATINVTAVRVETTTLSVSVGSPARTASTSVTVVPAARAALVWSSSTHDCSDGSVAVVVNAGTFTSKVTVVDAYGNAAPGSAVTVSVSRSDPSSGTLTGTTLGIPASATTAETTGATSLKIPNGQPPANTLTAASEGLTSATCSVSRT